MSDKGNNELLLNAIRNKFAAGQGKEATANSSDTPKFVIPVLKASTNSPILKPQENYKKSFNIPKLQCENDRNVNQIVHHMQGLQVNTEQKIQPIEVENVDVSTAIDLTYALRDAPKNTENTEQRKIKSDGQIKKFDIPFIECDGNRTTIRRKNRIKSNNIAATTKEKSKHTSPTLPKLKEISPLARLLALSYIPKGMPAANKVRHKFIVKHKIVAFDFSTKSPDDIILSNLSSKIHRKT